MMAMPSASSDMMGLVGVGSGQHTLEQVKVEGPVARLV
jgi:hypothetical protein